MMTKEQLEAIHKRLDLERDSARPPSRPARTEEAEALSRLIDYLLAEVDRLTAENDLLRELNEDAAKLQAENERLREAGQQVLDVILKIDLMQVVLNQSEPCCHIDDDGRLCGRANRWAGHPNQHKFVSLYIFAREALEQKP